mmetsp:Transcript_32358/g.52439  ORF Transcript_32358/g.52439 Transcript_32358/m.52439 type:complete len:107 (+) Transcript_32358:887-1207(+)
MREAATMRAVRNKPKLSKATPSKPSKSIVARTAAGTIKPFTMTTDTPVVVLHLRTTEAFPLRAAAPLVAVVEVGVELEVVVDEQVIGLALELNLDDEVDLALVFVD